MRQPNPSRAMHRSTPRRHAARVAQGEVAMLRGLVDKAQLQSKIVAAPASLSERADHDGCILCHPQHAFSEHDTPTVLTTCLTPAPVLSSAHSRYAFSPPLSPHHYILPSPDGCEPRPA
eukprot:6164782-Pleurochrysis_carterae.AAC.2